MNVAITPAYAAILGLVFVALSARTLTLRHRLKVAIGPSEHPELARAMRVHANFAEYVPLALLLILFVELNDGAQWRVHILGLALLAGRLSHAYGVSQVKENYRFRVAGMALTFLSIVPASIELLARALA